MADRFTRLFLGWDEPALVAGARRLLESAPDGDFGRLAVVVPGGRARRMLLGALVEAAESRAVALTPPLVITPGEIAGTLLGPPGRPASRTARRLAWVEALRTMAPGALAPAIPHPPEADDFAGWSRIASALERASDELAGEGLRFAEAPDRAAGMLPAEEGARWGALAAVQDRAEALLAGRGLVDEALATRAQVVGDAPPVDDPRAVVLLGVPELNNTERLAIQRGARSVTALVYAPESLAERFDDFGCVVVDAWGAAPVDLPEQRVRFVDTPRDQADAALASLAEDEESVDVGAVVLGVADPDAFPRLRRRAAVAAGVVVRSSVGDPATRTLPGRLLALLGAHLREPGFESLCALARHPDVEAALLHRAGAAGRGDDMESWLAELDEVRREHVLLDATAPPPGLHRRLREALAFVSGALDDLLGEAWRAGQARPLDAWAEAVGGALGAVYAGVALRPDDDHDRASIEALEAIRAGLDELADAAPGAAIEPTGWQAVELLLERVERTVIAEPVRRDAVETLGWLELALDPAPVCVVVGLADTCVPGSITHDPLLPDSLRERLGLRTNRKRLARDAFLLSAINASRDAIFFATRRGEEGDPRTPSRLLFRCAGETLAKRVRRFARPELDGAPPVRLASRLAPGDADRFAPPLVIGAGYTPPEAMSVTDFGAYLRSPMGWYLERCARLREHEAPRELSPMLFGSLAHKVLEEFGRDEAARELDDPDRIAEALSDLLTSEASRRFGDRPPAPVHLQTEMLRERLRLFAPWQAERRRAGWRIAHVEWKAPEEAGVAIDVDGAPMPLRGKIDRIDRHESRPAMALIDYKTGGDPGKVTTEHRARSGQWKSLQLPLYRHLAAPLGHDGALEFWYAGLPSSRERGTPSSVADWTNDDLLEADDEARRIIREIRAFAPGDAIPAGDHPPDTGALGFVTRARFDIGGLPGDFGADDAEGDE